jgi:hypothetical protein
MMSFDLHGTTFSLGLPDTHENVETQGLQRRSTRATASTTQNLKHSRYNESTQQPELRKPEGNATRLHAQHHSRLEFPSTSPGFELVPSSSLRMTRHNARSIQQDSYLEETHIRFLRAISHRYNILLKKLYSLSQGEIVFLCRIQ